MRSSARAIVGVAWLGLMLSVPVYGQELDVGTWSGSMMGVGQNRNSRPATLEVKMVPDAHWRWRGGPRELKSIDFVTPQGSYEVSGASLDAGTLSFSFTDRIRDDKIRCDLKRQADGSYEGDCSGGNFRRHVILRPPDAPPGA
jgi:hypothetical protein